MSQGRDRHAAAGVVGGSDCVFAAAVMLLSIVAFCVVAAFATSPLPNAGASGFLAGQALPHLLCEAK